MENREQVGQEPEGFGEGDEAEKPKGRPSTPDGGPGQAGSGRTGEADDTSDGGENTPPPACGRFPSPSGDGEELSGDEAPAHIKGGRNRAVQLARTGKRRFFRGKARQEFLEWFAATANVVWSARKAGFAHQTVWKHRMNDPSFAEDFDRALDQGLARVRAKLVESKQTREPIAIDGDYEAPELEEIDPQVAINLVREHERGRGGPAAGFGRKQGRRPRLATNAEVRGELVKRLKVFGIRVSEAPFDAACGVARDGPRDDEAGPPVPRTRPQVSGGDSHLLISTGSPLPQDEREV